MQDITKMYELAQTESDLFTLVHTGTINSGLAPEKNERNEPNKPVKPSAKVNILRRRLTGTVMYYRPLTAKRCCIGFLM